MELVRRVGFPEVEGVSARPILPSGGYYVEATTGATVSANKRTWLRLHVCEKSRAAGCAYQAAGAPMIRVGRWVTSKACIEQAELWRVSVDSWYVEFQLGPGTEYGDASKIVEAIRRRALVNRRFEDNEILRKLIGGVPDVDAGEIRLVKKARPPGVGFEVEIGHYAGYIFHVRIVDDRVELHQVSSFIT